MTNMLLRLADGESQKLVEAIFGLAQKLQPTIIFIDEIDSFLRERSQMDSESSALTKGQVPPPRAWPATVFALSVYCYASFDWV